MKVSLLLIATGKYSQFVQPLIDSAEIHFFNGFEVTVHLFTDEETEVKTTRFKVKQFLIPPYKFPYATLYRYNIFSDYQKSIGGDYVFYSDVDMRFVADCGLEMLPDDNQKLTVVQHPGYFRGGWGSPNVHLSSKAWVHPDKRKHYVCGGFNGGTRSAYLSMAAEIAEWVKEDERIGVMAEWHDESHLNKYVSERKSRLLSPAYCFPENWNNLPFQKKIVALDKDHNAIRA